MTLGRCQHGAYAPNTREPITLPRRPSLPRLRLTYPFNLPACPSYPHQIADGQLRKACSLVGDAEDYDEMDRRELLQAAGRLLGASASNELRFRKAIVQTEAKERWRGLSADARLPYEERSNAETRQWTERTLRQEAGGAIKAVASAASVAGTSTASERGTLDASGGKQCDKSSSGAFSAMGGERGQGSSGGGIHASGGGDNRLPGKSKCQRDDSEKGERKRKREETRQEESTESGEESVALAVRAANRAAVAGQQATVTNEPLTGAGKGGEVTEEPCPELGAGWKLVTRRRRQTSGPKAADKYYVGPDGKQFNSRVKVVCAAGTERSR